jgi:superfamily II helicase
LPQKYLDEFFGIRNVVVDAVGSIGRQRIGMYMDGRPKRGRFLFAHAVFLSLATRLSNSQEIAGNGSGV